MDILEKLEKASYRYAYTMPQWPHHYTLRKTWEKDEDFVEAVNYIREHGVPEMFGRHRRIYLYHKGYKYWTMGNPIDQTILINRAKAEPNK